MNLTAAIADLATSIRSLDWKPLVKLEVQDKGSKRLVTIVPGSVEVEERFGDSKYTHTLNVRAYFSATDTDPATVHERCRQINQCMCIDRRRGGNALTTITGDWTEEENDGRSLIIMASEPQIQTI
jgi:hypothetical protein